MEANTVMEWKEIINHQSEPGQPVIRCVSVTEAEAKLEAEYKACLEGNCYNLKQVQAKLAAATRTNMEYSKRVDADKKRIAELEGQLNFMSKQGAETVKAQIARIAELEAELAAADKTADANRNGWTAEIHKHEKAIERIAELEAERDNLLKETKWWSDNYGG
jgi:chromosome segregation ATPase